MASPPRSALTQPGTRSPRKVTMRRTAPLNRSRTIASGLLLAALATGAATARADVWREESDQTIPLDGYARIYVENARGEIDVRPGPAGTIRITAHKTARAASESRAKDLAARTTVETRRADGRFEIEVKYPDRGAVRIGWRDLLRGGIESPQAEVRLTLQIPPDLDVQLRSASADLSTLDLAGPQRIDTASGDVTVIGARGRTEIATSSGDIEARDLRAVQARTVSGSLRFENVAGPLHAKSTSGSISVRAAKDSLAVRSVSGDIDIDGAPLGLTASTSSGRIDARGVARAVTISAASGDVDVALQAPLTRADVSTVTGRIVGRLIDDLGCRLDMKTSGGEMEVLVPLELKSVSRREIVGVVNRGGAPVVLQTSAGDIELSAEASKP